MTSTATDVLGHIREKHLQLDRFLMRERPRKRRLINLTIVAGTLAAALTAGPALGGASFTAWLTTLLGLSGPSWRLLCGAAALCSVTSTAATQLLKSHNIEEHVARAQSCRAKLEVLEIGLTTGTLDAAQATAEYLHCVEDAAFLEIT